MAVFDEIARLWAARSVGSETEKGTSETGYHGGAGAYLLGNERTAIDKYLDQIMGDKTRQELYKAYEEIEHSNPEIQSILDIYADYCVSGGTHDGTASLRFKSKNKTFDRRLKKTDQKIQISRRAWRMCRSMVQHGDAFYETIVNASGVTDLKVLPRGEMYRVHDNAGNLVGYEQRPNNSRNAIDLAPWQVCHFRLMYDDEKKYGRSLLWAIRQEAQEFALMRTALTIARLSRAHRRLKYKVEVGHATHLRDIDRIIAEAKHRNRRQRTMNSKTGRMNVRVNPLRAEEDIYIPTSKDSTADVEILKGDDSITKIEDMYFKRSGILSGAKMSESWLGLTGPNIRNVADHQVINFIKTVKRIQRDFAAVLVVPYQIDLLMQGISWDRIYFGDIDVLFPKMSLVEDRLRYEIDKLRSEIAEKLIKTRLYSRREILVSVFELPDDEADRILSEVKEEGGDPVEDIEETLSSSEKNALLDRVLSFADGKPELSQSIEDIRYLIKEARKDSGVIL